MENKYLAELRALVLRELGAEEIKVVLFGSRAGMDIRPGSDVDKVG